MKISGRALWMKVDPLKPVMNKYTETKQWSFDLIPDDASRAALAEAGMSDDYYKTDKKTGEEYLQFVRESVLRDGKPGKPFAIVDNKKQPWDPNKKIGNDSVVNVKVSLNERLYKGKTRLKATAIELQVWTLNEYAPGSGFDTKEDTVGEDNTPVAAKEEW